MPSLASDAMLLGGARALNGCGATRWFTLAPDALCTHAVIVGATGSGKTGLLTVLVEEALRLGVPTVLFDVKGDLSNLLLSFSTRDPAPYHALLAGAPEYRARLAERVVGARATDFANWGLSDADVAAHADGTEVRVLTPGAQGGGSPLHLLSALTLRSPRWDAQPEAARDALSSAVTLLLRLLGREADPARSREHALLCTLAERRFRLALDAPLEALVGDVLDPPLAEIGALPVDTFVSPTERRALAAALNVLLTTPALASFCEGEPLDVDAWMRRGPDGRTRCTIVRVSHLDDAERAMVLALVLDELRAWMRVQPGARSLRALVAFDEVSGYLPPHPSNPATKRPLSALLKQGRAFGLGVVLATQHPMDLDYRALSDAGLWCVGKLQTDADRARVCESLAEGSRAQAALLAKTVNALNPRWFVVRDARSGGRAALLQSRATLSWLRGPLTPLELRALGATQSGSRSRIGARKASLRLQ